jgi:hypothetical protein
MRVIWSSHRFGHCMQAFVTLAQQRLGVGAGALDQLLGMCEVGGR